MRRIIFFLFMVQASLNASAQETKQQLQAERKARIDNMAKEEEEGVIVYKKSFVFGVKLLNDGYGAFIEWGRAKSVKKSFLYQFEITERKAAKETKQTNPYINSTPFIYGKENFVYPVKLGVQQQLLLGNKANKNGVNVTANYGGGLSLSLLRPYYLQVEKGNDFVFVKYNSPDSSLFLNGPIVGGPTFGKGWSDLSVTPGLYAKTSFRFDYGRYNEIVSAIEVGITAEYYMKKIPILIQNPEKNFFFSGFIAICFGKRK